MATTSSDQRSDTAGTKITSGPFNNVVFRIAGLSVVIILLALLAFRLAGTNLHDPAASRPPAHPSETNPSNSGPAVAPAPNK